MLGPPAGRYLLRRAGAGPDAPPTHVLVLATLGAPERRVLQSMRTRRSTKTQPEPEPTPVSTGRATVVGVAEPFADERQAAAWLARAGEDELAADVAVLNRALHAYRLATADPYLGPVGRYQALVARIGYGAGEEVADGLWTEARELIAGASRRRRAEMLQPQARLSAMLGGRESVLACQELTLRARLDVDHGREREAALQVRVALDAAIAELERDESAAVLGERLEELRAQRDPIASAAEAALRKELSPADREAVRFALGRIEAALRARAAASA